MGKKGYEKLQREVGIYRQNTTKKYVAIKKIKGKHHQKTFKFINEAKKWQKNLFKNTKTFVVSQKTATLKEVWASMQTDHFPSLEKSTISFWIRRYQLLKDLEHLPMDQILPSTITSWINEKVMHFKNDSRSISRGDSGRCNLNNEINLFITFFNWYKQSERYEKEALFLTCPLKSKHKLQGFIKPEMRLVKLYFFDVKSLCSTDLCWPMPELFKLG